MHMSPAGVDFLELEEGKKREAYYDQRKRLTIGVGHTGPVPGRGPITETMTITDAEVDALLRADLADCEYAVDHAVNYPQLTQGQFDALVSLAFNEGGPAVAGSTLVKKLNRGDLVGAAAEFARWNKCLNLATGHVEYSEAHAMRRAREVYCLFARRD